MKTFSVGSLALLMMLAIACSSGDRSERLGTGRSPLGTFTTIDAPGSASTIPLKFNWNGSYVVGTYVDSSGRYHGFGDAWQVSSFTAIDFTAFGTNTILSGYEDVWGETTYVGGQDNDGVSCLNPGTGICRAFQYQPYWKYFSEIRVGTSTMVFARQWQTGNRMVGAGTAATVHGWLYSGSMQIVDPPDAVFSFAADISNTGGPATKIVGRWDTSDVATHGYLRLEDGQYTMLDVPDAVATIAWGIDNAGTTIVGEYTDTNGVTHGFRTLDGQNFETIDFPGAVTTRCRAVRGNRVLGSYVDSDNTEHGFIFTS